MASRSAHATVMGGADKRRAATNRRPVTITMKNRATAISPHIELVSRGRLEVQSRYTRRGVGTGPWQWAPRSLGVTWSRFTGSNTMSWHTTLTTQQVDSSAKLLLEKQSLAVIYVEDNGCHWLVKTGNYTRSRLITLHVGNYLPASR